MQNYFPSRSPQDGLSIAEQRIDEWARLRTPYKILHLADLGLTDLPSSLFKLRGLTKLSLAGNKLRSLPEELFDLTTLEGLWVQRNHLDTLSPSISKLRDLRFLSLHHNRLRRLPDSICRILTLKHLWAHSNSLEELPKDVGLILSLQKIFVSDNQLSSLPETLRNLSQLEELYLHGNPALELPEDTLGPSWDQVVEHIAAPKNPTAIIDYYFSTRGSQGVELREMKLIVVGWGKAGKTTLVKRLANQPMELDEPETHGIMIRPLRLQSADGTLAARVWDFGGQHVLHAMHEFFLTARSLYLVVLEQRSDRTETDAKYWLQLIRSYAPHAPVVVALNKSQGIERSLDKASLERQYGPIVGWVPTECLPDQQCPGAEQTISVLRDTLARASDPSSMPELRKLFPRRWLKIKQWLETLDEEGLNYVDYDRFSAKCSELGEPDEAKQAEVALLMHELGVAMNYARDDRLRDTTVLRPDWLANGIYAILRANMLGSTSLVPDAHLSAETLGVIYKAASDLAIPMLRYEDYPKEKWVFILQLMNLFQLSFPVTEDGQVQLCPALLSAEPPPEAYETPDDDVTVRLRYEFPVVPAPLMSRFIVRIFPLIESRKIWQRGAILRYPGARAQVWSTPEEKYIFATVEGPESDRNELLSIIRNVFESLFTEYRELHVIEQRWFDKYWVPREALERLGALEPNDWAASPAKDNFPPPEEG